MPSKSHQDLKFVSEGAFWGFFAWILEVLEIFQNLLIRKKIEACLEHLDIYLISYYFKLAMTIRVLRDVFSQYAFWAEVKFTSSEALFSKIFSKQSIKVLQFLAASLSKPGNYWRWPILDNTSSEIIWILIVPKNFFWKAFIEKKREKGLHCLITK